MTTSYPKLNLPEYAVEIDSDHIFDRIRKKWVVLTPEEWVRQNFLNYLLEEMHYPKSLVKVEKTIQAFNKKKRCDAVIYSNEIKPLLILECKNPAIKITAQTFSQIAIYNSTIKAPYLIITNGMEHFCIKFNFNDNTHQFLDSIPLYEKLTE